MPKKQAGGAMINDIAELAIPFGLVLAQRGLSHLFAKDKKQKGGSSSHNCVLCNESKRGGGGAIASEIVRKEFRNLSNQLRELLESAS